MSREFPTAVWREAYDNATAYDRVRGALLATDHPITKSEALSAAEIDDIEKLLEAERMQIEELFSQCRLDKQDQYMLCGDVSGKDYMLVYAMNYALVQDDGSDILKS